MTWHHPALAARTINALDDEIAKLRADNERLRAQLKNAVWTDSELCKILEADNERLRAALWPFAMKGLKGTTVCADDFRRAKDAMPHAPDFEKPVTQQSPQEK